MLTGIFKDRHNSRLGPPRTPERLLGRLLQARSLAAVQFLRQAPVGPFTIDYVCKQHPLIVEIGDLEQRLYSAAQLEARVQFLAELGYRVVQVTRKEVMHEPAKVIARVRAALDGFGDQQPKVVAPEAES